MKKKFKDKPKDLFFKNWCPCSSCQKTLNEREDIKKGKKGEYLNIKKK